MRALVTGGGGFLGRYIVERLRARGDQVRSFFRGDQSELTRLGVECTRGDIRDSEAVQAACKGVDIVFHAAALAAAWGRYRDFYDTPSVVFPMHELRGVDESHPYPIKHLAHYPKTKMLAEKAALAANDGSLATCALPPHLIWGHAIAASFRCSQNALEVGSSSGSVMVDR